MTIVTPDKSPDARARLVAQRAIGCPIRLHLAERTYVTGRITACEFFRWQYHPTKNRRAVFKITIVAGAGDKWEYSYSVFEVPNPDSDELAQVQVIEFEKDKTM